MKASGRIGPKDWLAAAGLGAGLGLVLLGVGSRISMRGIALLAGQPGGFSLGGTATVVFLGMVAGVVAALVFVGVRRLLPTRPLIRGALFWIFLLLVTLRGLRPADLARLALFLPLVIGFGISLHLLWCHVYLPRGIAIEVTPKRKE